MVSPHTVGSREMQHNVLVSSEATTGATRPQVLSYHQLK